MRHPKSLVGIRDLEDRWKRIAASRLRVPSTQLTGVFHSYSVKGAGGLTEILASGAVATYQDRALRLSNATLAAAIAFELASPRLSNEGVPFILSGLTAKWFIAGEFRVNQVTAPIATTECLIGGFRNANNELRIGMFNNAANFRMVGGAGSPIDSGVPLDTEYRIHAGWRDGVDSFYALSLASTGQLGPAVVGTARPNTDAAALLGYVIEGAATLRSMDLKWACAYAPVR